MQVRRALAPLLFSFFLAAGATAAPVVINAEGQKLLDAGHMLSGQGKPAEALQSYAAAARADAASSLPLSSSASLLYDLSLGSSGDKRASLLAQAVDFARKALAHNNADPIALELLRLVTQDAPSPLRTANPAATRLINEGEALFSQKRYSEALALYEQAAAADPLTAQPWIYAGDCFYVQKLWPEAEQRFRKATNVEPLHGQAWRYLADALMQQGKGSEAHAALLGGIAAQPDQLPNWAKLSSLTGRSGTPLTALNFRMKASVRRDAAGKTTIGIDEEATKQEGSADGAFWISYGLLRAQNSIGPGFKGDYDTLNKALQIDAELVAKGTAKPFADPALARLRELAAGGRLEAAMLLLMYRESYRGAFEAWKSAHPDGVREFIAATGLRP